VHAQSPDFSLSIDPPVLQITAEPPADVEAKINIRNNSDKAVDLDILIKMFKQVSGGSGMVEFTGDALNDEQKAIKDTIKVYDGELVVTKVGLSAQEAKDLTIKLNLDKNVPRGDYYFSLIFLSSSLQDDQKEVSKALGGITTNLIVSIGKPGPDSGQISEFSVPFFLASGPVPFTLLVQNNGENYITPSGSITITDIFGRHLGKVDILPQHILVGGRRYLTDPKSASINGQNDHNLVVWPEKFLSGLYSAELNLKLSDKGPSFKRSVMFLSVPLYLVFAISLFTFVLLGILIRIRSRIKKNSNKSRN